MGIFGFGSLRDRFTVVIRLHDRYVASFDVTPMVVYALRNSSDEDEFAHLFYHRMLTCKEVAFLGKNPPLALHYTLDNRSPRAKRQTQLQRIVDARSLLTRLTVPSADLTATVEPTAQIASAANAAAAAAATNAAAVTNTIITPTAVTVISNDDIVRATTAETIVSTDGGGERRVTTMGGQSVGKFRISDVVHRVREVLLRDQGVFSLLSPRVDFDYDEGEGEIKALNWLARHRFKDRLIMARDNDVYVYILSKLKNDNGRDDDGVVRSLLLDNEDNDGEMKENNGRYLVYHESSNSVLRCWSHLVAYTDKMWLFQLWLSMCYGNDFVHGLLDKNLETVQRYYAILESEFVYQAKNFVNLTSKSLAKSSKEQKRASLFERTRDEYEECAIDQLVRAMWVLQRVLLGERHVNVLRYSLQRDQITLIERCWNENGNGSIAWRPAKRKHEYDYSDRFDLGTPASIRETDEDDTRSELSCSSGGSAESGSGSCVSRIATRGERKKNSGGRHRRGTDNDQLRLWVARQLWSFFYILELPSDFSRNQRFASCPSVRINASFGKPFLGTVAFINLDICHVAKLIRSIFEHGI